MKTYTNRTNFDVLLKLSNGKSVTVKRLETIRTSHIILKIIHPHEP